jgi:hypothetical protein
MSLHPVPKTIFNSSLKLARAPFDVALGALGGSKERQAKVGEAAEEAAADARRKAEQQRRKAEKRRREREARAAKAEQRKKAAREDNGNAA